MIFYCEFVCNLFYVISWLLSGLCEVLQKIMSEKVFYSKKCLKPLA